MTPASPPFVGRVPQLEELRALREAAAAGTPRVVVLRGPAGSGKTRLLERMLADGGPGQRVLRAEGTAWERTYDGAVLRQLLDSAPVPGTAGDEPAAGHADAASVPGAAVVPRPGTDAVPAGHPGGQALLSLLCGLSGTGPAGPVLLVVENLQWVDTVSLQALHYAVRRLGGERVFVVLTLRGEEAHLLPEPCRGLAGEGPAEVLELDPLDAADVMELASAAVGVELSVPAAHRLATFAGGNPRHLLALLRENHSTVWRQWQQELPAPGAMVHDAAERLATAGAGTRALVAAAAVLGTECLLSDAAAIAESCAVLDELDEVRRAGLLAVAGDGGTLRLRFPGHIERAAVYHGLSIRQRIELHGRAAARLSDRGAVLRHRAAASLLPDAGLAGELEEYAAEQAEVGAWGNAADALFTAGRLRPAGPDRSRRLLQAVDAMVGAGELPRALTHEDEIAQLEPSALREAVAGYLAILQGRAAQAETRLTAAWRIAQRAHDRASEALVAQRQVLHALSRWDGPALVDWAERAVSPAEPESPAHIESAAIMGLGLGITGRSAEADAIYAALFERRDLGAHLQRVQMGRGWLHLALDRTDSAHEALAAAVPTDFSSGSYRISLWASGWLARTQFASGAWDQALRTVGRGLALQQQTGMELARPLLHWTAAQVHAMRGSWDTAVRHLELGRATGQNYPVMLVPHRLAQANVAEARADYDGVLRALEPLLALDRTTGIDEPGFWPWQDVYANALVMKDRAAEASVFLEPHEGLAAVRGHRTTAARLGYVRGRILADGGNIDAAAGAFEGALAQLQGLNQPYVRSRVDFAYGQTLRRAGKRRDSTAPLSRARELFAGLGAQSYVDRCDRELQATGTTAPRRDGADWSALTAQEKAVSRLVAGGASNRRAAEELVVSVKTVQYHLTHTYEKLGISSRTELAARYREDGEPFGGTPA